MSFVIYFTEILFSNPVILRCTVLTAAVLLDLFLADPYTFPHPVKFMGFLIKKEEAAARRIAKNGAARTAGLKTGLQTSGFIITAVNILISFMLPYLALKTVSGIKPLYLAADIAICYTCIAARSLHKEALKVKKALCSGLEEGRKQVACIVGRDVSGLSEEEVIKACVESVAENTTDGVIAPLFFMALLGAPGGFAYKMINTMDSMLGYKNEKYAELGFFPAKTDDIVNFIPARLSAFLIMLSAFFFFKPARVKKAFLIWRRDRKNHAGPNPAQTESAAAGLLGIKLGGTHLYSGKPVEKPEIGDEERKAEKADIIRTVRMMYGAEFLFMLIFLISSYIAAA